MDDSNYTFQARSCWRHWYIIQCFTIVYWDASYFFFFDNMQVIILNMRKLKFLLFNFKQNQCLISPLFGFSEAIILQRCFMEWSVLWIQVKVQNLLIMDLSKSEKLLIIVIDPSKCKSTHFKFSVRKGNVGTISFPS